MSPFPIDAEPEHEPGPINLYFERKPEPGNEPEPGAEPRIELGIEPKPEVEPGIEPEPGLTYSRERVSRCFRSERGSEFSALIFETYFSYVVWRWYLVPW